MRTAEEWGRLAVSLPGWRWMPGMAALPIPRDASNLAAPARAVSAEESFCVGPSSWDRGPGLINRDDVPDPDDPATAGCLLALLGPGAWDNVAPGSTQAYDGEGWWAWVDGEWSEGLTLGRACIAAAEALGRWPNGGRMVAE